jgi:hypothetical protein
MNEKELSRCGSFFHIKPVSPRFKNALAFLPQHARRKSAFRYTRLRSAGDNKSQYD